MYILKKQFFMEWVSFFLGSWEMNRSAEQTNRVNRFEPNDLFVPHCDSFPMNREKKIAVHAICLFRTAIHLPWTEKKDTHSLYLQCLQQRPLLKFSEQSMKFKIPAEIGHLTLFQDKTILAYSFRQNSAGSWRRFCRLFIDISCLELWLPATHGHEKEKRRFL